jgi:alpha-1,3-rhamnosyl/mannosyltransferase
VIAVSEATRVEIVNGLGVPSARAVLVRNRVDEFFLRVPPAGEVESILQELGLSGAKYVLHVGASFPYKNLERAILALAELGDDRPLLVKAGAPLTAPQLRLAAARGVRTRALGDVDHRTLRALYRGATALLYPSLHEGFGWPVAEALACGTPVVTSTAGGLREVTAGAAVEVDPRNVAEIAASIRDLVGREDLRRDLSRRGFARGSELAGGDVGAEVLAVYRAAASESGP